VSAYNICLAVSGDYVGAAVCTLNVDHDDDHAADWDDNVEPMTWPREVTVCAPVRDVVAAGRAALAGQS
jgi:hypothetical protein